MPVSGRTVVAAFAAGLLVAIVLVMPAAARAQDDAGWSTSYLSNSTEEDLIALYEHFRRELNSAAAKEGDPTWGRYHKSYADQLRRILSNFRKAFENKGMRVPPGRVPPPSPSPSAAAPRTPTATTPRPRPPGGSNTAPMGRPGSGNAPAAGSAVLPLLLVLTTAEMAKCAAEGIDLIACGKALALRQAAHLVGGAVVTVLVPGGATLLTAVAVTAAAGSLVITAVELTPEVVGAAGALAAETGANLNLDAQRAANAARVSAANMDAIVTVFGQRIAATTVDPQWADAISKAQQAMASVVEQARAERATFRRFNELSKIAARMCADPEKNPVRFASDVEKRAADMKRAADSLVTGVADARALVVPCTSTDGARRAKDAYAAIARNLESVEQLARDARADTEDAAKFFAVVKAGRKAVADARASMAKLSDLGTAVREAESRLRQAVADYEAQVEGHRLASAATYRALENMKAAFPAAPPPHIAQGLARMDDAYVRHTASVLTDDRLAETNAKASDEATRVEGMHRLSSEEFEGLDSCGRITDEMPAPLRTLLMTLGREIDSQTTRARTAVEGGRDIATLADQCVTRLGTTTTAGAEGRLTGHCTGAIDVSPLSGRPGTPLNVRVTIDPPGAQAATRVVADNPSCTLPACREMRLMRMGSYSLQLTLQAPPGAAAAGGELGSFRLKVSAFADDRVMCSGESPLLRVLAR